VEDQNWNVDEREAIRNLINIISKKGTLNKSEIKFVEELIKDLNQQLRIQELSK